MEDFEKIALGLQPPRAKAQQARHEHIPLSHPEASALMQAPNSLLYNVILRIMEGEIEKMETEHLSVWKKKEEFERTGLVAVSARLFYERVQKEINFQISEFIGNEEARTEEEKVKQMSPEELIRKAFGE